MLLLIVYIMFITPLSLAVDLGDVDLQHPWTVLATIDFVIDMFFIVDMAFNFFTSYIDKNGVEVTDRKEIQAVYLQTWFAVDVLSSIPFGAIQLAVVYAERARFDDFFSHDPAHMSTALRASRFVRFVKVTRLVKSFRILSKSVMLEMGKIQQRLLRDLGILVVLLHFVACMYIIVAYSSRGGELQNSLHGSWVHKYLPDIGTLQEGAELNGVLYVCALYWAVTTVTTTGFGDIVPANNAERVVAIVAMLVSAAYYGYVRHSLMMLLNKNNNNNNNNNNINNNNNNNNNH